MRGLASFACIRDTPLPWRRCPEAGERPDKGGCGESECGFSTLPIAQVTPEDTASVESIGYVKSRPQEFLALRIGSRWGPRGAGYLQISRWYNPAGLRPRMRVTAGRHPRSLWPRLTRPLVGTRREVGGLLGTPDFGARQVRL